MADFPLVDEITSLAFPQDYSQKTPIDGVRIIEMKRYLSEEGDFAELLRLKEDGSLELAPEFKLRQINRTQLYAGSIKAWHFHYKQDEVWYVAPNDQITVGLWDLRKNSPTAGTKYKVTIGDTTHRALFIPRGVAHGSANYMHEPINLFYFVNQNFNQAEPDEFRLHWDAAGKEFWLPERD